MCASRSFRLAVAQEQLSAAKIAVVKAACSRAGIEAALCSRQQLERERADVLVGVIRAGQQRIPQEYLEFVDKCSPEASLLLFCEQALAQPFVSLSEGRVTLLGPDSDEDSVYCRLRVLLAERGVASSARVEKAAPSWWLADTRTEAATEASVNGAEGSLTLTFSLPGPSRSARDAKIPALDAQASLRAALSGSLAPDTGLLHFAAAEQEWLVAWPARPSTLWLLSSLRLPMVSDLSLGHGGRGSMRLRAASGDIALAVSTQSDDAQSLVRGLLSRLIHGGPAVFDEVSQALAQQTAAWATVVEVR